MEEEGFIAREDGFITISFMPELPALQTHHKIDMVSVPSMTQEEYEKSMLELGYVDVHAPSCVLIFPTLVMLLSGHH